MKRRLAFALSFVACFAAGCAEEPTLTTPPKLDEIVDMARHKVAPEEIVAVMRETHAVYSLSGSQLVRLHDQGVPDPVIDEMQRAQLDAAREEAYQRATSRTDYWYDPYGGWTQTQTMPPSSLPPPPAPSGQWWKH